MFAKNHRVRFIQMGVVSLCSLALHLGCSDDGVEDEPDADPPQIDVPQTNTERWEIQTIETGGFGLHPRIARADNGSLGVAYISTESTEISDCTEIDEETPPPRSQWTLRYAAFDGTSWTPETIAEPPYVQSPPGIDLIFNENTPIVAGMTGEPNERFLYCGVNNVGLYTRNGGWTAEDIVTTSSEVIVNDPASDFGEIVGYWPAVAIAPNGDMGIAYKDVHGGGLQSDDFRKADLEFAWRQGGSWNVSAIDASRGAGDFSEMVFDTQSRPVVIQYIPTENAMGPNQTGVWVHRSEDGSAWQAVQIHNQPTSDGPSLARDATDGTLYAAFYNAQMGFPRVATLTDPDQFESAAQGWEFEDVGDNRFDEGYGTSIAAQDGIVGLAHYRCTRVIDGLGECAPAHDALVFDYKVGGVWTQEIVDEGESAACGNSPSLVFDADGRPVIVYRCEVESGDRIENVVRVARRTSAL